MINKIDAKEMSKWVADAFRTQMTYRSVDISGDDYEATLNFVQGVLSNYIDNKHILDKQLNPATNRVEVVDNEPERQTK